VAHYLFNFVTAQAATASALREQAAALLRVRMWGVDAEERLQSALPPGELTLIYLGAPVRAFIGHAEIVPPVHNWTPSQAAEYPGDSPGGVFAGVEAGDPPVAIEAVLAQIDPAENAAADFQSGVVRITANEYATALAVAATRFASTG
jgi:hypothetical protein